MMQLLEARRRTSNETHTQRTDIEGQCKRLQEAAMRMYHLQVLSEVVVLHVLPPETN